MRLVSFGLVLFCLVAVAPAADIKLTDRKLEELKSASVFIKVSSAQGEASGSGFIFEVKGGNAHILTNHHVVDPYDAVATAAGVVVAPDRKISVVVNSGTPKEISYPATLLCTAPLQDVAILRISNVRGLTVLPVPKVFKPRETDPLLALGYPFGAALGVNDANPAITITKASVSSLRRDEWGKLSSIQIDGSLNPGNSGGPVVDAKGQVLGLAVAAVRGANLGFVIPLPVVSGVLDGQVAVIGSEVMNTDRPNVRRFSIIAGFADPFSKISSVTMHVHRLSDVPEKKPQATDEAPGWPLLTKQSETVSIQPIVKEFPVLYRGATINSVGEAEISLTARRGETGPVEYLVQFETTHVQSPKRYSAPIRFIANFKDPNATQGFQFEKPAEAEPAAKPAP